MDSLQDFEPTDTTGFVAIQSIRYIPHPYDRTVLDIADIFQA